MSGRQRHKVNRAILANIYFLLVSLGTSLHCPAHAADAITSSTNALIVKTPRSKSLLVAPPVSLRVSEAAKSQFNLQSSFGLSESEKIERDVQRWRSLNGANLVSKTPRVAEPTHERILNYLSGVSGNLLSVNPNAPPGRFTK